MNNFTHHRCLTQSHFFLFKKKTKKLKFKSTKSPIYTARKLNFNFSLQFTNFLVEFDVFLMVKSELIATQQYFFFYFSDIISMALLVMESGYLLHVYHFIKLREYDDYEAVLLLYLPCFYIPTLMRANSLTQSHKHAHILVAVINFCFRWSNPHTEFHFNYIF